MAKWHANGYGSAKEMCLPIGQQSCYRRQEYYKQNGAFRVSHILRGLHRTREDDGTAADALDGFWWWSAVKLPPWNRLCASTQKRITVWALINEAIQDVFKKVRNVVYEPDLNKFEKVCNQLQSPFLYL